MSQRLTKNMYVNGSDLFGLRHGQIRAYHAGPGFKNAGWYNRKGEKLGSGCLSSEDVQIIKDSLEEGEVFVVLSERHSSYGVPEGLNPESPGRDYIKDHARLVIDPSEIFWAID